MRHAIDVKAWDNDYDQWVLLGCHLEVLCNVLKAQTLTSGDGIVPYCYPAPLSAEAARNVTDRQIGTTNKIKMRALWKIALDKITTLCNLKSPNFSGVVKCLLQ